MLTLGDFSGGLNLRDSPTEIAPNETPDALNWTLDTRGATKLRNGCLNAIALPGDTGTSASIFYSAALDKFLCARKLTGAPTLTKLYTRPGDLSGSWTDQGGIGNFLTEPRAGAYSAFVDFPSTTQKVVVSGSTTDTTVGGIYTWDGTTLTRVSTTIFPYGMASWQNRVWVIAGSKFFACKIGDAATWAVPDGLDVNVLDQDAKALTAIGVAGGALIIFKRTSTYRVNDSSTGAYTTLDSTHGCLGPHAIAALEGRLYVWGDDGIYECDGIGPLRNVSGKLDTLFRDAALAPDDPKTATLYPIIAAGTLRRKIVFAYPSAASSVSDRLLEYDPVTGSFVKHRLASTSQDGITCFAQKNRDLYAAAIDGDDLLKVFSETPGADDGTLFGSNNYRTPWLQPGKGKLARIMRAQVEGLTVTGGTTTLTLNVYTDWDLSAVALAFDISTALRGGDSADQVETAILHSLGHSRAFAFEFVAGTAAGAAQVNSLSLDPILLER